MTAEEAGQLWQTPERWEIFERLGGVSEPLRIPDLVGYVRSLGFAEFSLPLPAEPASPFLASQMLHGSERVGNIFLAGRGDGREFSAEDEQTLVMFAAQAALVIANARTHREERRARADLETLIDTSPVGVVVFDALTGAPKSFNREARRIADMLRDPDQSPETLLEVITCVRADGREFSLREFPLAELLSASERVRAEEIVLAPALSTVGIVAFCRIAALISFNLPSRSGLMTATCSRTPFRVARSSSRSPNQPGRSNSLRRYGLSPC